MIESLLNPEVAEKKPYEMLFVAVIIIFTAAGLAAIIARQGEPVSQMLIAFALVGATPLFVKVLQMEEEYDEEKLKGSFLYRHRGALELYGFYFIGVILAVSAIFTALPAEHNDLLFNDQIGQLGLIREGTGGEVCPLTGERAGIGVGEKPLEEGTVVTGRAVGIRGICKQSYWKCVELLFLNNAGVLVLALVFSFVLGAGAIYIITWNATIVGVLIGQITRSCIDQQGSVIISYLVALPYSILSLFPHGIFEVSSWFLGGLAGGMLSAAIMKGHIPKKQVVIDVTLIFAIAVFFVFLGAMIEASTLV